MKMADIDKKIFEEIRGLLKSRQRTNDTLTPLEQLVLFGEVGNEIIDNKEQEGKKTNGNLH